RWERFERPIGASDEGFTLVDTWFAPLCLRTFWPNGLSASATVTYVKQRGTFFDVFLTNIYDGRSEFAIADFLIRYQMPRRQGAIAIGVRNAFNQHFLFQSTDRVGSPIEMGRFGFASFELFFH
ncbi:unnamed protein product, partial [Phaeothamnion confervicola]